MLLNSSLSKCLTILTFWASSERNTISMTWAKATLGADEKGYLFLFTRSYTAYKYSYFKISVNVSILRLYGNLFLKFWKLVIFQWGSIMFGIFKSVLLYGTFKLFLTSQVYISKYSRRPYQVTIFLSHLVNWLDCSSLLATRNPRL